MQELIDSITNFFSKIPDFIENNATSPIFWVVLLLVMIGITFTAINKFNDK